MNLSQTSVQFKKFIIWVGFGITALILIWFIWLFLWFLFNLLFQPKPAGPDLAFGKLPDLFQTNTALTKISFNLDTPGQVLPASPQMLSVYAIPDPQGELNSLNQAKAKARGVGLDAEPISLSENRWSWTAVKNQHRLLKLNIVNNNFTYTYDWVSDTSALNGVFKTTDTESIKTARSFVNTFKAMKDDLKNGPVRVTYFKLNGNYRNQVGSYSEANAVQVELFRDKVAGMYNVVETDPLNANIKVLFSPTSGDKQLLELDYIYWTVDFKTAGTYPLKTASEAFTDLKKGLASFAEGQSVTFDSVDIFDISLAYLNPTAYTRFFQPVWVFKGQGLSNGVKKDFVGYVLAIRDSEISR